MKICITSVSGTLDSSVDPRFGRCAYFVIGDPQNMKFDIILNDSTGATHGAGIQAAQNVVNMGVEVVISGNVGPNAFNVLTASGIKVITGASGRILEVIKKYKNGLLKEVRNPSVSGHFGIRKERGRN
jgi:predicted Fe-Mo cluster-binding NifX family protein